jgi:hypothetical protein
VSTGAGVVKTGMISEMLEKLNNEYYHNVCKDEEEKEKETGLSLFGH